MIRVTSIRRCHVSDYDDVYLITRNTGSTGKNMLRRIKHLPELGPNADLFFDYLRWGKNGELNQEKFNVHFKHVFINQITNNPEAQKWLDKIETDSKNGRKIALISFGTNENLDHRGIIAEMLRAKGCDVVCDKDIDSKRTPIPIDLSSPENIGKVVRIIDEFEAMLDKKGLTIENEERDEYAKESDKTLANPAIIFGSDYYKLEDTVKSVKTVNEIVNAFRTFAEKKNLSLEPDDFKHIKTKICNIVEAKE